MENGSILNMPEEASEYDVLAEAKRLTEIVAELPPIIIEPTPDERLDAAITEYIALTSTTVEDVATKVLSRLPVERKKMYLDAAVAIAATEIDAEPIDTGGVVEKPIDIVKVG